MLPRGTTGRFFTLLLRDQDTPSAIEVDLTAEGLGDLLGAVLEQLDNRTIAEMVTNQIGYQMARELGTAIVDEARSREQAAQSRVGTDR